MKLKNLITKNENFSKLWFSQIFSQLTIYIVNFILLNRIFDLTKSPLAIYFIWLFYSLSAVFIAPFISFLIDLWDNKKILVISILAQAATIASYFFIRENSHYFIYVLVFLYSAINQFYLPTQNSSVPWLVKKESYTEANSLLLLTTQFSLVAGLGLGGIFLRFFGEDSSIIISITFLLLAAFSVSALPREKKQTKTPPELLKFAIKEIKSGWNFILKKKLLIVFALILMGLFQVIVITIGLLLPTISEQILNLSLQNAIPLMVFSLALGLISGGFIFGHINKEKRKKQWISRGFLVLGLCLLITSFVGKIPTLDYKLAVIMPVIFIAGIVSIFIFVPAQTFVQETTPNRMRGKIYGILNALIVLSTIPPTLFVAGLVEVIGIVKFIQIISLLLIGLSVYIIKHGDNLIVATNNRS